jgi:hypothetical protein
VSATRRLNLEIQDPLEAHPQESPAVVAVPPPEAVQAEADQAPKPQRPRRTKAAEAVGKARAPETELWSGVAKPAGFRIDTNLLDELDARTHRLRLGIGITVQAAIVQLLEMTDAEITGLVDRAEEAQERARRATRRRRAAAEAR